ncbi:MAG: tRNA pseudouridine(55) synthase TruB [Chloroflexi bacterium]|nr:tRNA pseudouridine(55) synthase TruB [Chloroflexota bacterium]
MQPSPLIPLAANDFTGILNINKPKGWTSHDVVARVRRLAGQKRIGHAGTLDPMAQGVLPILLGRATRLADYIQQGRKTYVSTVRLGVATDTEDADGQIVAETPVPDLSPVIIEVILASFRGDILQIPPRYSALKVGGKRAYTVARGGGEVNLAARPVTIHEVRLLQWSPNEITFETTCSKGTYIRSLARDIALALGTVGHLTALVRSLRRCPSWTPEVDSRGRRSCPRPGPVQPGGHLRAAPRTDPVP